MFLFGILLAAGFFGLGDACWADDDNLIISEIQTTEGTGKTSHDFIELYNPTANRINLKGYRLVKRTAAGTTDTSIKSWTSDTFMDSHAYYLWANSADGFATSIGADASTGETIADNNGVALRFGALNAGSIIDSIGWGECKNIFVEKNVFPENQTLGETISRKFYPSHNPQDTDNNAADFVSALPSPKKETILKPPPKVYSDQIRFSELLPSPAGSDSELEFIEFYNAGEQMEDLDSWKLKDSAEHELKAKTTGDLEIKGHDYLVINPNDYGITLPNSSDKTLILVSPDGVERSLATYSGDSVKENVSLSFDGTLWRWTKFITKGDENKFSQPVKFKIKKEDTIYTNIYADFSADVSNPDNSDLKFTWDFGDNHSSYLSKTEHKYAANGAYAASLKIFDGSEDTVENFPVIVSDFPEYDLQIVGLSPNPKGKDSKHEWLEIKNKSKEKINLKNWSLATGWKKMINHPIRKDFILKPGKSKKITGKFSSFTMQNKKSKIELRNPAGEVVAKAKYSDKDGVQEDAVYAKTKHKWQWQLPETENNVAPAENVALDAENNVTPPTIETITPETLTEDPAIQENLGKFSEDISKKQNKIVLLSYGTNLTPPAYLAESPGRVLGAATSKTTSQKNWLENLWETIFTSLNSGINKLLFSL